MLKEVKSEKFDNMEKGPIRRSLFCNGAVLLTHKSIGFSGAKVSLNFLAGSIFEAEDQHGISHMIEHLLFKESETSLIKTLEFMGAEINAYTYKENVCFELSCLGNKLNELLPSFFEIFFNLEFSDEQLEKEKKIVIQELTEDKDDHETQGLEFLFNKNFKRDVGHEIGGTIANVKSFTKLQILAFYKKYYTPERLILTVVTGKSLRGIKNTFIKAMDKKFHNKIKAPFRLKALNRIKKLEHGKSKLNKKMESAILFYSFDGPSLGYTNYYDYVVLDELLFEGLSSLFFKKFREESALVYGLGSSLNSFKNEGNYIMVFNTQNHDISKLRKGFKEVLDGFLKTGVPETEIELIKNRIIDSWEISFDSIEERVDYISDNEIYQFHEIGFSEIKTSVNKVSIQSITKLLTRIYKESQYTELEFLKK